MKKREVNIVIENDNLKLLNSTMLDIHLIISKLHLKNINEKPTILKAVLYLLINHLRIHLNI